MNARNLFSVPQFNLKFLHLSFVPLPFFIKFFQEILTLYNESLSNLRL